MKPQTIHGVVAAILIKNKTFLGVKRKLTMTTNPGIWEFPGGKIEANESPQQALQREVKEELSIIVHFAEEFFRTTITLKGQNVILYYFIVTQWTGDIVLIDHDTYLWHNLKTYQNSTWLTGDEVCVFKLKQEDKIN